MSVSAQAGMAKRNTSVSFVGPNFFDAGIPPAGVTDFSSQVPKVKVGEAVGPGTRHNAGSTASSTAGLGAMVVGAQVGDSSSPWTPYSPTGSSGSTTSLSGGNSPISSKPASPRERFESGAAATAPSSIRRSTSSDYLSGEASTTPRPKLGSPRLIHPSGALTARHLSASITYEDIEDTCDTSSPPLTPRSAMRFTIGHENSKVLPADSISLPGTPPNLTVKIPAPTAVKMTPSGPSTPRGSASSRTGSTPTFSNRSAASPGVSQTSPSVTSSSSSSAVQSPSIPHIFSTPPPPYPVVAAPLQYASSSSSFLGSNSSTPPAPPLPPHGWRPTNPNALSTNSPAAKGDMKSMIKDWKKREKEEKKARKEKEKEEKKALKEAKEASKRSKSSKPLGASSSSDISKRSTKDSSPATSTPSSPSRSTGSNTTTPPISRTLDSSIHSERPMPGATTITTYDLLKTLADSEDKGAPLGQAQNFKTPLMPDVSQQRYGARSPGRAHPSATNSTPAVPKTTLADFRIIKLIGKGGFGEVYLVEHIKKQKKYALKVLDKSNFVDESKMQQVLNERAVLVKSFKSPFLLSLSCSFHDEKYLYFVMKYCPGGDLRALLSAIGAFEEDEARLYMAEMIVSVDALHRLGYIHRDLKPDNFLIDSRGHLVLADFGLSKAIWESSRQSQKLAQARKESSATSTSEHPPLIRNRSLSTLQDIPQNVSGHVKEPSILLGPQDLVTLNATNVDSRFIRRRRRDANGSDMTSSFNPMTHSYNPSSTEPFGFSTVGAMPAVMPGTPGSGGGPNGGFSFDGESTFGMNTFASSRMSVIFDSDNPMSSSYNPMTGTFSAQSVRPVIQFSDLPTKAQQRRLMAYSVVGSPDYMSPEVLSEHGYGEEVDWWSVGCLCFELVLGIPPFTGQSIQEVFDNIANWETRLPQILAQYSSYLSPICFDLLSQLLCDPSKRLGKNGISEIKKHPFFSGLNWDLLFHEEPPFVPRLESDEDTSYFEANVANKQQSFLQPH